MADTHFMSVLYVALAALAGALAVVFGVLAAYGALQGMGAAGMSEGSGTGAYVAAVIALGFASTAGWAWRHR